MLLLIRLQTSITLKVYRTRLSTGEETTEDIQEKTTVRGEAKVTAKVVQVDYDNDGLEYIDGDEDIDVEVSLDGSSTMWGGIETTKVKITLDDIPGNVQGIKMKYRFAGDPKEEIEPEVFSNWKTITLPDFFGAGFANMFTDLVGDSISWEMEPWFPRYKTKSNTGKINMVTTSLETETKLDIAVEKAKTWYATITYDNYVQDETIWETETSKGKRYRVYSPEPQIIAKTRNDDVYKPEDDNFNEIIDTTLEDNEIGLGPNPDSQKGVEHIIASEISGRVENWFANLTSDNILYWGLGGPLTHNIYKWLDGDKGRSLATENELLNIRFIYAMDEGIGDEFTKSTYTPIEVTYEAIGYDIGVLHTTINNQLIKDETPKVKNDVGFFLSLLKNNKGTYDKYADYNPDGKEVVYKTVYDSEDRVGRFFETSAEMLFNLLDSSLYTEGLTSIMKYIMYEYTTRNYGVTDFTYEIFPKKEFKTVY